MFNKRKKNKLDDQSNLNSVADMSPEEKKAKEKADLDQAFADIEEKQKKNQERFKKRQAERERKKALKNKKVKFSPESNTGSLADLAGSFWRRLIGDYDALERPPVTESRLKKLFTTRPSFVDYFPFVDFDEEYKLFAFNDGISYGAVFDIIPKDLDARSQPELENFCDRINSVLLSAIPIVNESPFVIQFFLEDREPKNITREMDQYVHASMRHHKLYEAYKDVAGEHFSMMSNPSGIFPDDRVEGGEKGWRAINRKLTMVIYRKATLAQWMKGKPKNATTAQIFDRDIQSLVEGIRSLECKVSQYNDQDLFEWLVPWFNPNPVGTTDTAVQWVDKHPLERDKNKRGASWDLAQMICPEPPIPIDKEDAQRGIVRFGNQVSRYITLQSVYSVPREGVYTTDIVNEETGDIRASIWDKIPSESIMTWTIIPTPQDKMINVLESLDEKCDRDANSSANAAIMKEQIQPALHHLQSQTQRIFYFQAGIYLRADSVAELDTKYYRALATLESASTMRPIQQEHDLFPFDSYIRNMPFVYDPQHDRRSALRAFMTYTSHIAAVLPLYGRSRGSNNPCFINYNRSGEVIRVNPYSKDDKSRVSHSITFGPTGSGKSATQVGQSLSSMVMNFPRQFFIDKGGSFALLADYYERNGLNVRRIFFQTSSDVSLPPFAETEKAILEFEGKLISDGTDEEERRSYIGEMLSVIFIMVTGGNPKHMENMEQQDRSHLQSALYEALLLSVKLGEKHARPEHLVKILNEKAAQEKATSEKLADRLKKFADSVAYYTSGTRGQFFNREGQGFSDSDDVVVLELGVLTENGSEDMLAIAMSSLITAITQMGERNQFSGRAIEVYMDECHYVTANPLLVDSVVVGVKVWRKINIWLNLATQNITDFPNHASKILGLLEFWWLLTMSADEATKLQDLLKLSSETQRIIRQCKKKPPYFIEGVLISEKYQQGLLLRFVPPALLLALGMTDGDEKKKIQDIVDRDQCSKLDAALQISRNIVAQRKTFSPSFNK